MSVEILDIHTHVWPDSIAAKAMAPAIPEIPRRGDGRVASLLKAMDEAGVARSVCLGIAGDSSRVEAANRFAGSLPGARLIGFGSLYPDWTPDAIVANLRANKLRGIKLHPIYQHYDLSDRRLAEILDALQGEFIVLTHVGSVGDGSDDNACSPAKVLHLMREFPRLELVAAHFGGYRMLDTAEEALVGRPIHIDTSWPPGLATLDPHRIRRLIEKHGPDRVIFGSDWPMASQAEGVSAIRALGLPEDETRAILGGNLSRLIS